MNRVEKFIHKVQSNKILIPIRTIKKLKGKKYNNSQIKNYKNKKKINNFLFIAWMKIKEK